MRRSASTRIIEGSGMTRTLGLVFMTSATTLPTWLFISVNPHMFEAVLSDLKVVTVPPLFAPHGAFGRRLPSPARNPDFVGGPAQSRRHRAVLRSQLDLLRSLQVQVVDDAAEP